MARGYKRLVIDDFTKGVWIGGNTELPYFPDMVNLTITPDGWLRKRRGAPLVATRASANAKYVFVSHKTQWTGGSAASPRFYVQDGASLYKNDLGGGGWTQITGFPSGNNFTTSAKIQMCDFGDEIYIVHPVDGVWSLDTPADTSATNRSTTVTGNCIAPWQNKLWVGGDTTNPERIWWSNIGDGHTWTTASDYVDIREDSNRPNTSAGVRAVGVGNGMDVIGRGGVFVFKDQSIHRIYDSATGAYTTEAIGPGAGGPEGVTSGPEGIYCANNFGIWFTATGEDNSWVPIHNPVWALWTGNLTQSAAIVAFSAWGRHYFAKGIGNYVLEYVPESQGWFPMQFRTDGTNYRPIISASPVNASGSWMNPGATVLFGTDGSVQSFPPPPNDSATDTYNDDPSNGLVVFKLLTPWIQMSAGQKFRCRRMILNGTYGDSSQYFTQPLYIHRNWGTQATRITRSEINWTNTQASAVVMNQQYGITHSLGAQYSMAIELGTDIGLASEWPNEMMVEANGTTVLNYQTAFALRRMTFEMVPLRF